MFKQFVLKSISNFDVGGYEGEKVYHAFVLGMLISINDTHEVLSNRESGTKKGNPTHIHSLGTFEEPNARFGLSQYDVMIIPRDISKLGIVIEFKKLDFDDHETLEETAE